MNLAHREAAATPTTANPKPKPGLTKQQVNKIQNYMKLP
jgi:hypothetical protein